VVEGAPLLRAYGSKAHRGFESLPLRHLVCAAGRISPTSTRPAHFALRARMATSTFELANDIRASTPFLSHHMATDWACITAWNPGSRRFSTAFTPAL
jgi:hypothetical protein